VTAHLGQTGFVEPGIAPPAAAADHREIRANLLSPLNSRASSLIVRLWRIGICGNTR
jgi:hypothetical protein